MDMNDEAKTAYKYESWAKNASRLISRMDQLDNKFLKSLDSLSLTELKENTLQISIEIEDFIRTFIKDELPEDAYELLISKKICFTSLSRALGFKKVDLKELRDAQAVFDDWNLKTFTTALDSLVIFIQRMDKYRKQMKVPEKDEEFLLQLLRTSNIESLDGVLSEEITKKIRAKPFSVKIKPIERENEIELISVSDTEKDLVRVCLVQLDYSLTERFPYRLKEEGNVKDKVLRALEIAKNERVDIICFPELSFTSEWAKEIKDLYKDMIIVCGSFYDNYNRNLCKIIIDGDDYDYAKCYPSIFEKENGEGLNCGNKLFIFQTKCGKISILTCIDFDYENAQISKFDLNFIINLRCDPNKEHAFQRWADVPLDRPDGSRSPTFILQVNTAKFKFGPAKGGGGTAIIGCEHPYLIERYKHEGLRPKDAIKYKIFQARDEMMLIADLNIVQTTERRTKSWNWYKYKDNNWNKLDNKGIWLD